MNWKLTTTLAAAALLAGATTTSFAAGEGSTPGTAAGSTHSHTVSKTPKYRAHLMNRARTKYMGAPSAEGARDSSR
jgi:hypothetical protein